MSNEEARIEQMINDILSYAKAESKITITGAKKQVEEIVLKGKERAEKEKQLILDTQLKLVMGEEKQQIALLNLQARREILQKKEDEITKVFELAKSELEKFPKKEDYKKVLNDLIIEAGTILGGGNLQIKARKEDLDKLKDLSAITQIISKKSNNKCSLKIAKETINAKGGVIMQTEDQSIEIDNTFEARLDQKYKDIRTQIANTLFE